LELAAVHAALLVHVVEIRLDAVAHLNAQLGGGSGKHRGLTEHDGVLRHALSAAQAWQQAGDAEKYSCKCLHRIPFFRR